MSTSHHTPRISRAMKPTDSPSQPPQRPIRSPLVPASALATTLLALAAFAWSRKTDFKAPAGSNSIVKSAPIAAPRVVAPRTVASRDVAPRVFTARAETRSFSPAKKASTASSLKASTASSSVAPTFPAPRLTRAPYIQWTTTSSAHIVWDTDRASSSQVDYQLASPKGSNASRMSTHAAAFLRVAGARRVLRHIVKLAGLRPSSTYLYRVASNDRTLFQGRFQTDKRPGEVARIAIWGDSGVGDLWQYHIAARIEQARPDCLVHTGDLIYPRGAERDFDPEFFRVYAHLLSRVPFYGSLGNHDVGTQNGAPFLADFVFPTNGPASLPPERNYAFDYAGAHWVVIDSNQSEEQMRRVIVPWLERDSKSTRATWKFAVFHHPPFSSGEHGDEIRTQRALSPTFARMKFDIVFNGHDHGYERWKPRAGVVYITTAGGGANLYHRTRHDPMTASYHNEIHSWTQLDVRGKTLHGQQIGSNGRVLDSWTMSK